MNAAHRAPSVRRTARLAAVAAALALPATTLATTPAHAASSCVVNGVAQPGPVVTGTPGPDVITCSSLDAADRVDALEGNDIITLTGLTQGRVNAGDGRDLIRLIGGATLTPSGDLDGQVGNDLIELNGHVHGTVRGGQDSDAITLFPGATTAGTTRIRAAKGPDSVTFGPGVVNLGLVEGVDDDDIIVVPVNLGTVDGGPGFDICVVGGNRPLNCELP
ncbi:hypothetical protein [Streptomyces telluris]|uniref:Secreted protein n=1 Tax=Streptomyces telluris TaxID=2720021 RepID=A0A9X2RQ46_9ACTN|nr:hypothetical protein [Streptomyces telluris]MCQ8774448.1 hypothetical protein [Streptomyces telluris]NJP80591.1 hypothetical protein [Streptomyces telluris]